MMKKHAVLIGIVFSIVLLVIAACYYPGGSQIDKKYQEPFRFTANHAIDLFLDHCHLDGRIGIF